jgi:predicted enzyme related to lactoylglutathione lyase
MTQQLTGLGKIGQIGVRVHDVERATAFYRDILGIEHQFSVPGMSFFNCDGTILMLATPTSDDYDHPGSILYFQVESISDQHAALVEKGVEFLEAPHFIANMGPQDLWMAFFHDSEDNVMALRSLVPAGATAFQSTND